MNGHDNATRPPGDQRRTVGLKVLGLYSVVCVLVNICRRGSAQYLLAWFLISNEIRNAHSRCLVFQPIVIHTLNVYWYVAVSVQKVSAIEAGPSVTAVLIKAYVAELRT